MSADIITRTNTIKLSSLSREEKQKHYRKEFEAKGSFQKVFGSDCESREVECMEFYHLLRRKIAEHLINKKIVKNLVSPEDLHNHIDEEMKEYNFVDGVNKISNLFYDMDDQFTSIYHNFIRDCLKKILNNKPFYFQTIPTIRLHCPNAVNSDHYPRYHTDIGYGHPPQMINIWMPLTAPIGKQKHGFRVSTLEHSRNFLDKYDYDFDSFIHDSINTSTFTKDWESLSPQVTTENGKALLVDSRIIHTAEPMLNHTRVSIDTRVILVEDYNNMGLEYQGSGRRKILFKPGHCYHESSSSDL